MVQFAVFAPAIVAITSTFKAASEYAAAAAKGGAEGVKVVRLSDKKAVAEAQAELDRHLARLAEEMLEEAPDYDPYEDMDPCDYPCYRSASAGW